MVLNYKGLHELKSACHNIPVVVTVAEIVLVIVLFLTRRNLKLGSGKIHLYPEKLLESPP